MDIKIVFENEEVLVLNKPAGLIVHNDGRTKEPSLSDWVIEKYPENINLLNEIAVFFETTDMNYDKAEEYFIRARKVDPENPVILGNYAAFLLNIRNDQDQAENYFSKAVNLDPSTVNLGNYAHFLSVVGNYQEAEKYFKKALEKTTNNANNLGNYAHHLIVSKQDFTKAEVYIDMAFNLATNEDGLQSELWFYRYAHFPEYRVKTEKELEKQLPNKDKVQRKLNELAKEAHLAKNVPKIQNQIRILLNV